MTHCGLFLQLALPLGHLATLYYAARVFGALGDPLEHASGTVTGGVAEALKFTLSGGALALPGAILLFVVIAQGGIRERSLHRWAMASFVPWVYTLGLGTVVGTVGLGLLWRQRNKVEDNPSDLPQ